MSCRFRFYTASTQRDTTRHRLVANTTDHLNMTRWSRSP